MNAKRSTPLLLALIGFGLMMIFYVSEEGIPVSINGQVCNHSSHPVWLTVTESSQKEAYALPPSHCTNVFTQDAEAIWGKDCSSDPCQYQAWKVSAGRFDLQPDGSVSSRSVLQIKGWGVGSHWHISRDWPKPELSAVNYSLVR